MNNKMIRLSDGRNLGYVEYGDLQGCPLFFFHGQPGNRLFRYPNDELTSSLGVRLITVDRPGYGLSDFQPGRQLMDWPGDVCDLADFLGIARFSIFGFSAGGPYALACAKQISHRLNRVGIVDSAPPMYLREINKISPGILRTNYRLSRYAPSLMNFYFHIFWRFSRGKPNTFLQMAIQQSCPSDREVLSQPIIFAMLKDVWLENIRVNCRGYTYDTEILMRDWGFQLKDIQKEIRLWQGEADANIPTAWARYLGKELPNCQATFYPNEGHFALFQHWNEILQTQI